MPTAETLSGESTTIYPLPYEPRWAMENLPVKLPKCSATAEGLEDVASDFVKRVANLQAQDFSKSVSPVWRDSFALTGTRRTFYGSDRMLKVLSATLQSRGADHFALIPTTIMHLPLGPDGTGWVNLMFSFQCTATPRTDCTGILSIIPEEDGKWKIWMVRTILDGLQGELSVDKLDPVTVNGTEVNGTDNPSPNDSNTTTVLIIGGSQSGIALAGRLSALQIPYIVVDKNAAIGDSWRKRYDWAKLHTIREFGHLPFERTFDGPSHDYREWMTKDDLANGHQRWTRKYGIDKHIRLSSEVVSGTYSDTDHTWTVNVRHNDETYTVSCKHIAMCVGPGGQRPLMPSLPNQQLFHGTITHSANFTNSSAFTSKHGIVVGTGNTAQDMVQDMIHHNLSSVTMLQKRRTYVLPAENLATILGHTYNEHIPTEVADKIGEDCLPLAVIRLMAMKGLGGAASQQKERFEKLEEKGFKVEPYGDVYWHIKNRLGGHFIDMGAGGSIAEGKTRVVQGVPVRWTEGGVVVSDGRVEREVEADLVVFATGFEGDMKKEVGRLFGKEVAERCDEFWGVDDEGEPRGMYKKMKRQPGMWYHGLGLDHARWCSRWIALQIKAEELGTPLPLYEETV